MRIKIKKLFERKDTEREDLRKNNAVRVASYSVKHGRKHTGTGFDLFELEDGEFKLFVSDAYLLEKASSEKQRIANRDALLRIGKLYSEYLDHVRSAEQTLKAIGSIFQNNHTDK